VTVSASDLNNQQVNAVIGFAKRAAPFALLVLIWQTVALLAATALLPTPVAVVTVLASETFKGPLLFHLSATLTRVALCFFLAMSLGTILGLVMGMSARVNHWLDPWLQLFLNIPAMVVAILAYLWLGLGEPAAILAVTISKLPNVVVIIRQGARQRDPELIEMAQVYKFTINRMLFDVLLPELMPYFIAATRSGLSLVWKIVLLVELLGLSNGIGFQLHLYFQILDIKKILAYAASFMFVVQAIEMLIFTWMDRRVARWQR